MTIENAFSALGLLGIGGVIGHYFRILWERRNAALLHKQEFKEARFKCIVILMYSIIDFEKHRSALERNRPDPRSRDNVIEELKAEWHNAILFASDEVLEATHAFIREPSAANFKCSALAMRRDLWGGKSSSALEELEF